jgi:TP901 family phage tail tape measure protein
MDIFVSLGLNMDNFNDGITKINRQMKLVESEFQAAAAKLGGFGKTSDSLRLQVDALTQKIDLQRQKVAAYEQVIETAQAKIEKHAQSLANVKQQLEQARAQYDAVSASMGKDSAEAQALSEQISKLEKEYKAKIQTLQSDDKALDNNRIRLNNARAALAEMENELRQANAGMGQQTTGMSKFGGVVEQVGSKLSSLGGMIKASLVFDAVYKGIDAVTGGIKGILTTSMDFEAEMSKVRALSGANNQEFEELRQTAIKLGADSVFSASEAAQGMTNLAAAGFNAKQIVAAMPGILNAAAASGEDFASVSDIMISAMNDFGLQAKDMGHIADDLAAAANASSISISDIGVSLKYVGPAAHAAGLSLEEVSAALAILGNNGIKADTAGTSLRMGLQRLVSPPKSAANALKDLGIQVTDSTGKVRPLADIIGQLHNKFQDMSKSQQLAAASAIFGAESMSAWLTLIQKGPGQLEQLTNAFIHSKGAAQQMANTMNDNLKGSIQQMEGAFESLSIKIGQAVTPALRTVVDGITRVVQSLTNGNAFKNLFPPEMVTAIKFFGDEMKQTFQDIKSALGGGVAQQLSAFFEPFKTMGPQIANTIENIGAAIHAIVSLVTGDKNDFTNIMNALKVPPSVQKSIQDMIDLLKQAYQTVAPQMAAIFKQVFEYIKQNGPEIAQAIKNAMQVISTVFNAVWPVIKVLVIDTLKTIMDAIKNAVKVIEDVISVFADVFTGNWGKLWQDIKKLATDGLKLLWDLFQLWIGGKILSIFKGLGGSFAKLIGDAMGKLLGGVKSGWEAVIKYFSGRASYFGGLIKKAFDVVTQIPREMVNAGRNIVEGLWNGIVSMGATLKARISSFVEEHIPKVVRDVLGIRSPSRVMMEVGGYVGQGLEQGVRKSSSRVRKSSQDLAQSLINGLKDKLGPVEQTVNQLKAKLKFDQDQGNTSAAKKDASQLASAYQQAISRIQSAMRSVNAEINRLNPRTHASDIEKLRKQYAAWGAEVYKDKDALHALKAEAQTTVAQNLLNKVESNMDSVQKQIDILQAEKQYLSDSGKSTSGVDKSIASEYQKEIKTIQSSIKSLQSELKKLDPKTQGDLVKQVKDKIADLNTELYNTKDALVQLNNQKVTNLINQAGSGVDPIQKQISVLQAEQQYLQDVGKSTTGVTKQIASDYQKEIKTIQSSIKSLQNEIKKLNPKTQGDLIKQAKDKLADLNGELWQTKDAMAQLQQSTVAEKVSNLINKADTSLDPIQKQISVLQAQIQYLQDAGQSTSKVQGKLADEYKKEISSIQSSIKSLQGELKKLNPKTQGDQVKQIKDKISDLNAELYNTKDTLQQLQNQSIQTTVSNLINSADTKLDPINKQLSVLQAQMQYMKDAGKDTSSVTKQIAAEYKQEISTIQSSIKSLQAELKKLDPKKQADQVKQIQDKISDLNSELWQTKDALQQLNSQAWQQAADSFKQIADQQIDAINTALQNELSAMQQAHQKALDAFDAETQAMEDAIDQQIAALQQQQTEDDRANQQQQWDSQMADLQHQLAVAQMMNDPRTVKQVQDQIDQLNQQIADQKKQWAIQDQEQALQQQKQQLEAERAQQRQALDQEWQDRENAFQQQMQQTQQHFQALESALEQALQTGKLTLDQANAAWLQAIKDTGDQQVQLEIEAQQKSQDELNKWVDTYLDIGKKYGQSLGQGLVDGLNSSISAVQSAAVRLAQAVATLLGNGKSSFAAAVSGMFVKLNVPAMAGGGILTGPTLLLGGEAGDEAILPLNDSTMGRLANAIVSKIGGVRGGGQQPINVYIGNDLVASYVWDYGLQRTIERQRKG